MVVRAFGDYFLQLMPSALNRFRFCSISVCFPSYLYLELISSDCDRNDAAGCIRGLYCGNNNCGDFHEISEATGINDKSDCCTDHFHGDFWLNSQMPLVAASLHRIYHTKRCCVKCRIFMLGLHTHRALVFFLLLANFSECSASGSCALTDSRCSCDVFTNEHLVNTATLSLMPTHQTCCRAVLIGF